MQMLTCFIFVVLFSKKYHGFVEKGNSSENVFILEKELDGIAIDDIRNLEDASGHLFIDDFF